MFELNSKPDPDALSCSVANYVLNASKSDDQIHFIKSSDDSSNRPVRTEVQPHENISTPLLSTSEQVIVSLLTKKGWLAANHDL